MRLSHIVLHTVEGRRLVPSEHQPGSAVENDVTIRGVQALSDTSCHVRFEATTSYGVAGLLRVAGDLEIEGEGTLDLVDAWRKESQLPREFTKAFQEHVLAMGLNVSMTLARFVGLPFPLSLPPVRSRRIANISPPLPRAARESPEIG